MTTGTRPKTERRTEEASARLQRALRERERELSEETIRRKRLEERLFRVQSLFNQAEQLAHLGAWWIDVTEPDDLNRSPLYWSDETYRIFGYEPGAVPVSNDLFFKHVHPDDRQQVAYTVARAIAEKHPYAVEHRIVRTDGAERTVLEHGEISFNRKGKPALIIGTVQDITELRQSSRQAAYLRYHDQVTDLYTRAYFEEELRRLDTEREMPLSIILGDINNLKLTNDVYGHEEGDKLLKRVADIMKTSCRRSDIIARWGGDEYSILLPATDFRTAETIAGRIKSACAGTKDMAMHCSIALGTATKETMGENIGEITRRAEERLNKNKLVEAEANRKTVIDSMLRKVGTMDHDTREHTLRMQDLALRMGKSMGLNQRQLEDLVLFAALHDIGKASLPGNLLSKPGRLAPREWDRVKQHTELGYRIAHAFPELSRVAEAILYHHERWDGSGYPKGLRDDQIPLLVRILSIIDAYDVMTHARSYKKAFTLEEAVEELKKGAGKQFDPELTDIFIGMVSRQPAAAGKPF